MVVALFFTFNKYIKMNKVKMSLLIGLFIAGFTLYYIGYYETGKEIIAASRAFFSSVQMFVINNNFETMTNPLIVSSTWGIPALTIISILIFAIVAQTIVFTVFKEVFSYVSIVFSGKSDVYLFDGYSETFKPLYASLKKSKIPFYFYGSAEEKAKLNDMGHYTLRAKWVPLPRQKTKPIYVFLLGDDELANVKKGKEWLAKEVKDHPLNLYIRIQSEELQHAFHKLFDGNKVVRLVSEMDLLMREAFKRAPLEKHIPICTETMCFLRPFRAFIGGLDGLGVAFFKHMTVLTQSLEHKPEMHLHDEAIQRKLGVLKASNPQLSDCVSITAYDDSTGSEAYFQHLLPMDDLDYVVFAYEKTEQNIELASIYFERRYQAEQPLPVVFCYVPESVRRNYLHSIAKYRSNIIFFGGLDEIMNIHDLTHLKMDQEARMFHDAYEGERKTQTPPGKKFEYKKFEDLDSFSIKSNRALIDHLPIKLALLGLTADEAMQRFDSVDSFRKDILKRHHDAIDRLARLEHERWNAFHFINGWITKPLDRVTITDEKGKVTFEHKDMIRRTHACLIGYDDLALLTNITGGDFYAFDINNITNIPVILRTVHGISKDSSIT